MADEQRGPMLGRLESVPLRNIWETEAMDFTPWLAQDAHLGILSDTLGLELVLEAQEKSVGPFRADLLCKNVGSDEWVLIENQLERTDHTHLGQLLTYASGLEAVTIIWIAARFTEEHRSTLDWLNRITDEHFKFFGVEVELWRIADSPAAPKFNVVSMPNNWSKSVAQAARAIDESELSEVRIKQRRFWEGLHAELDRQGGPVSGNRKAQPQSWMNYSIGRSEFSLGAVMLRRTNQLRAELYTDGPHAEAYFLALEAQREEIEQALGYPVRWERLPQRQACRVEVYLKEADPENEEDWHRQHQWLAQRLNDFHQAFAERVKGLTADVIPQDHDSRSVSD